MKFKAASAMDSKNYLRLKDKDTVKGIFQGEPYEFKTHWNGKQSELCSEDSVCPHCAVGLKAKFRFRINFVMKEGDAYVAKIFEQGWTVYNTLKDLSTEYDLENYIVKIGRSGSGINDTVYSIVPVPSGAVLPQTKAILQKVELMDLRFESKDQPQPSKEGKILDPDFKATPAFDSDEEIPF